MRGWANDLRKMIQLEAKSGGFDISVTIGERQVRMPELWDLAVKTRMNGIVPLKWGR